MQDKKGALNGGPHTIPKPTRQRTTTLASTSKTYTHLPPSSSPVTQTATNLNPTIFPQTNPFSNKTIPLDIPGTGLDGDTNIQDKRNGSDSNTTVAGNGADNGKQCGMVLHGGRDGEPHPAQGELEDKSGESGNRSTKVPDGERMDALDSDSDEYVDD